MGLLFSIDAVYIDAHGKILQIVTLAPWHWGPYIVAARGVLELPAGTCQTLGCRPGDQLKMMNGNGW